MDVEKIAMMNRILFIYLNFHLFVLFIYLFIYYLCMDRSKILRFGDKQEEVATC